MKKIVTCFLTWLLVMQLFSLPGKAMQFQEKQIPVYDAFAEKFDEISLMFDDKEVYIKIDDLNQYTGYHFKDTENETCFTKGNRKVVIDDQKISYGDVSDDIRIIEYQGENYISLLPAVDYFEMRIDANENGLIIYHAPYTYAQLIEDMINVMNQETLKVPDVNGAAQGLSWINKLIDLDIETLDKDSRLNNVILRILKEDDTQAVTGNDSLTNVISMGLDINDIIQNAGHLDCLPNTYLDYFSESQLMNIAGTLSDLQEAELNVINHSLQIGYLYQKNIDNLQKVIMNKKYSPYLKNSSIYQITKKYCDAYGDREEELKLVYDYFKKENSDVIKENILKNCLPASLQAGLATYSVIAGDKLNLFDYSEMLLYQKEFHNFQAKIIRQLDQYLSKISKGQLLANEEKEYFVNLSRLYFQIAVAYYDYMSEEDGKNAAYDGVKQIAKDKIASIDHTNMKAMLFDDPEYEPTTVTADDLISLYKDKTFVNVYDEYLQKYQAFVAGMTGIKSIQLIDLDNNDVPEMLLYKDGEYDYSNCSMYSINKEGNVFLIDEILMGHYATFKIDDDIYYIDDFTRTSTEGQHKIYKGVNLILDVSYGKIDQFGNENSYYVYYQGNTEISQDRYQELISAYDFDNEFSKLKEHGYVQSGENNYAGVLEKLMDQYAANAAN